MTTEKDYSLYTIEQNLIAELEDNKEEILESEGDYLHEYVDGNISVYTYDQIRIYADNNELWSMTTGLSSETVRDEILGVIYQHLSGVAWEWYNKQQELNEVA